MSQHRRPAELIPLSLLFVIFVGYYHSADPPTVTASAATIWSSKANPLNRYFAKLAWLWTTLVFAPTLFLRTQGYPITHKLHVISRYLLASIYWYLMTQWCFGPSLFDRVFVVTGGVCVIDGGSGGGTVPANSMHMCRSVGGRWSGGHDISGHCFLLMHSTLFLVEEVIRPLAGAKNTGVYRNLVGAASVMLVAVWVVMLHFTAKFFHGPLELISGSALGVAYWAAVYYRRQRQAATGTATSPAEVVS